MPRRFFRFYNSDDPMSQWGHAMFKESSSPHEALENIGHYGKNAFELETGKGIFPEAESLKKDILKQLAYDYKKGMLPLSLENQVSEGMKGRDFIDQFNPDDIVDSAAAYDDDDIFPWFYEKVVEPKGISGVITNDGAISWEPDTIKKIASRESIYDDLPEGISSILAYLLGGVGASSVLSSSEAQAAQSSIGEHDNSSMANSLGIGARSVLEGLTSLPDIVANPIANMVNYSLGGDSNYFRSSGSGLADFLGLPKAETPSEKMRSGIIEGVSGGVGAVPAAGLARAAQAAPNLVRSLSRYGAGDAATDALLGILFTER